MQLVVAEKPSVARDLARVLGVPARGQHCFESTSHGFAITWCVGHLVELDEPAAYDPAWKAWRLDVLPMLPAELRLRAASHARDQLRAVTTLLRDRRFTGAINACDAGREGELIFRYVYEYARCRLPVRRLWVSSLTDEAIRRGFAALRPGDQLDPLADAARCRSEADWLVGMNATRAVTSKGRLAGHDALYSIGRVQTPTLAMLVEREHAITTFVPRDYWEVHGRFRTAGSAELVARWTDRPPRPGKPSQVPAGRLGTERLAEELVGRDAARGTSSDPEGPRVERVDHEVVREPPPMLFDLTSLQRTANRRYGFSAQRTLEIAQALYERHKAITYPRTDSRHLSSDVVPELPAVIQALASVPDLAVVAQRTATVAAAASGSPPTLGRRFVDDAKVTDHHAIIPTSKPVRAGALDRDESRLFDLIARRFLAAFHPDAEIAVTQVVIRVGVDRVGGPDTPALAAADVPSQRGLASAAVDGPTILDALPPPPDRYVAKGRTRLVAGWQEVAGITGTRRRDDADDSDDARDRDLPKVEVGDALEGTFEAIAKQTTPPPRYTEATLLGAMETAGRAIDDESLKRAMKDRGLGTPATRASIIETLLRRGYVERTKQHLIATPFGIGLVDGLPVASLRSPELTGQWEARLSRVARGEEARAAFMADIRAFVTHLVDAIRGAAPPPPPAPGSVPARSGARARNPKRDRGGKRAGSWPRRERKDRRPAARETFDRAPSATDRSDSQADRKRRARRPSASMPPARARPRTVRGPHTSGDALSCPRCSAGTLITGNRGWGCSRWQAGCKFVVWFELAGRRITDAQLRELVTRGRTRKTRDGRIVLDIDRDGGAARRE